MGQNFRLASTVTELNRPKDVFDDLTKTLLDAGVQNHFMLMVEILPSTTCMYIHTYIAAQGIPSPWVNGAAITTNPQYENNISDHHVRSAVASAAPRYLHASW